MGSPADIAPQATRARVLRVLQACGTHATSFQILESGYTYWFDPAVSEPGAVVAYAAHGRYRVVAGAPLAPAGDVAAVAARFIAESTRLGCRVLFFQADDDFIEELRGLDAPPAFDVVPIGELPEWDPRAYHTDGRERRTLRAQVQRARTQGVRVRSVEPEELASAPGALRAEIEGVLAAWIAARRMSAMRFLVDLQPFHMPAERRYFVAEQGDRAVGFLAAIPIYQRAGWFFEDVLRVPDAPNGTVELLVDTAMRDAARHGDLYVTLGLSPLAGVPTGPGPHRWMRLGFDWCFQHLGPLYSFDGVRRFKQRFAPDAWQPQYLLQSPPGLGVGSLHAVLSAFAGGGLGAFGADTLVRLVGRIPNRVWAAALFVLAGLLVPWTALLALADGEKWFGDVSVQRAWVTFDSLMVFALAGLGVQVARGRRSARMLAAVLTGATATDFVLTTAQALELHARLGGVEALFVLAGMAGPLTATLFLVALAVAAPLDRVGR